MNPKKKSSSSHSKKRHRQANSLESKPHRSRSYDRDSVLVYHEVEITASKSSNLGWIGDFATPNLVRTRRRPNEEEGARSLHGMVLQKLGIEAQDLTVEALHFLPWTVGQHIWQSICTNHTESYYIWRTFAIAFGRDFADPTRRYHLDLKSPSLTVSEYLRGVTSKDNSWLTCLRLSPKQLAASDLVSISSVSNLTVLDLSDGQHSIENRESTFDMRIMRSWSELARSGRAFKNLRVLMLGWQEKIDNWIFDFLDEFPKLRLLIISRCRNFDHKNHRDWEDNAWSHHWTFMPSKRGVKHLRTLLDDKSLYKGKIAGMHHESGLDPANADSQHSLAPNIPLLELWLGTPRAWTHIMDEYAGTGTIYFRKKRHEKFNPLKKETTIKEAVSQARPSQVASSPNARPKEPSSVQRRNAKHSAASLLAELSSGS